MNKEDIIYSADFLNLTKEDTDNIVNIMDINIDNDIDIKNYLFSIKNQIFEEQSISNLVMNKIFAGKTSVKWYSFEFNMDEKTSIVEKLESDSNYYNKIIPIDTKEITSPMKYTCIKIGNDTYMMRIMDPSGSRTFNDGRKIQKIKNIKNITVITNLNKKYIEIRSDSTSARKIINEIMEPLLEKEIKEINVLGKYNDCLETFRNSLEKGKFVDVTSKPDLNVIITREQNNLLVNTLNVLDEYFINKDIETLKAELLEVDLGMEEIPFTQLFLAGLSQIGMGTRVDIEEDLTDQSLYGILKAYMTNQSGFINFELTGDSGISHKYTILVGIKTTNSISFRSSSTEEAIEYIRNKILG